MENRRGGSVRRRLWGSYLTMAVMLLMRCLSWWCLLPPAEQDPVFTQARYWLFSVWPFRWPKSWSTTLTFSTLGTNTLAQPNRFSQWLSCTWFVVCGELPCWQLLFPTCFRSRFRTTFPSLAFSCKWRMCAWSLPCFSCSLTRWFMARRYPKRSEVIRTWLGRTIWCVWFLLCTLNGSIMSSMMSVCSVRLMMYTPLFEDHPLLLFCRRTRVLWSLVYCGFSFSFLSTRVNISHLCRRRLDWRFAGAYPMLVLTFNSFFPLVDQDKLLICCVVALYAMYSWYVITVVQQIKHHLGIRALHLSNTKSDWCVSLNKRLKDPQFTPVFRSGLNFTFLLDATSQLGCNK